MGTSSLLVALDYLEVLADVRPDKFETPTLTLAESLLALAALGALQERRP